jgi:hypothetical protein
MRVPHAPNPIATDPDANCTNPGPREPLPRHAPEERASPAPPFMLPAYSRRRRPRGTFSPY